MGLLALQYHETTKHHFNRFARSLGYLDWASQPDPFRQYVGAPQIALPRLVLAGDVVYDALFDGTAPALPIDERAIGEFLRCSMGLSAWKQYQKSRWALRVNPSSGNLHPTETYVVWNGRVCHYAPRDHLLEARCVLSTAAWPDWIQGRNGFLIALTSILWREAWKYGERAFRYCQHDVGHAIGALRISAARLGWRVTLLPQWSDAQLAVLLGTSRADASHDEEREEPECIAVVTPDDPIAWRQIDPAPLVAAAREGQWHGTANRLSTKHVAWEIIARVAEATRCRQEQDVPIADPEPELVDPGLSPTPQTRFAASIATSHSALPSARDLILQRRSALAFDARSTLSAAVFMSMLDRLRPPACPWDAIDWPPHVHLALFVHRVEGLAPGIYAYLRDISVLPEWKAAMRPEFLWEPITAPNDPNDPNDPNACLFLLVPVDVSFTANRVSCDQEIAGDGFFSLGMLARLEEPLRERGEWFYRRLFWECGLIGQILYLEAEAAGARSTGIGCFYDDAVHEVLGLSGHAWQSLYHFSMGMPVDDSRLTTEPGYPWETSSGGRL